MIRIIFLIVLLCSNVAIASDSLKEIRMSAHNGDADAQYTLAMMYEKGEQLEQNSELSLLWFRKSAEGGNADAQVVVSIAYSFGVSAFEQDFHK